MAKATTVDDMAKAPTAQRLERIRKSMEALREQAERQQRILKTADPEEVPLLAKELAETQVAEQALAQQLTSAEQAVVEEEAAEVAEAARKRWNELRKTSRDLVKRNIAILEDLLKLSQDVLAHRLEEAQLQHAHPTLRLSDPVARILLLRASLDPTFYGPDGEQCFAKWRQLLNKTLSAYSEKPAL